MAGLLTSDPSHHGVYEGGSLKTSQDSPDDGGRWYFSRKEIEENSPSRRDGIDLKKEAYLRKSYCTFLQDLGMRLKVPQVTIATAIIFCHRFFLRQSHAKNDRRTIATVCMFLAGKVEETPRPLKDVILVSYDIIHKKDPAAVQKIKQKEVYEQQKELILLGERVVLATLGFDLNVHHPYKPLVEAIKKFKVAQNALAQVAWNFVNDGLRTSLCLQFKPHHIAAGAIFLAAKFLKVKLPSDGEKVSHWWLEFDVTARQLEEVSNQMLELYEQNRVPASQASEAEGSAGTGVSHAPLLKVPMGNEEHVPSNSNSQGLGPTSKPGTLRQTSSRPAPDQPHVDNHGGTAKNSQNRGNDYGSMELKGMLDQKQCHESGEQSLHEESIREDPNSSRFGEEDQERLAAGAVGVMKDKFPGRTVAYRDDTLGQSPQEAIKKIDTDKVKAALEKRRKSRVDTARKKDVMDDDDLIERELEDGIELAPDSEKINHERRQSWPTTSRNVEEGELAASVDDVDGGHGFRSPVSNHHKRKAGSPLERSLEGKQRHDYVPGSDHHNHHIYPEDRNRLLGRHGYSERDKKRHLQENHV